MSLEHVPSRDGINLNMNSEPFIPEHLTIQEFGDLFGPKATKTYALLKSGQLKAKKIGRLTVIPYVEAKRWANNLPAYGGV